MDFLEFLALVFLSDYFASKQEKEERGGYEIHLDGEED